MTAFFRGLRAGLLTLIAFCIAAGLSRCGKPNIGAMLSKLQCEIEATIPETRPGETVKQVITVNWCRDRQGRTVVLP